MNWLMSFLTDPVALDPVMVPFITKLIAGNILTFTVVWAVLKYCAFQSKWAMDDKVIQFLVGMFKAVAKALPKRNNGGNGNEPTPIVQ